MYIAKEMKFEKRLKRFTYNLTSRTYKELSKDDLEAQNLTIDIGKKFPFLGHELLPLSLRGR